MMVNPEFTIESVSNQDQSYCHSDHRESYCHSSNQDQRYCRSDPRESYCRSDPRESYCRSDPRESYCRSDPRESYCHQSSNQDRQEPLSKDHRQREPYRKKICGFFNTVQGCKNGLGCNFAHDQEGHEKHRFQNITKSRGYVYNE
jgi:hypothetical protein